MKKIIQIFVLLLFFQLLFASCTLEKRIYRPGFHFNTHTKHQLKKNKTIKCNDFISSTFIDSIKIDDYVENTEVQPIEFLADHSSSFIQNRLYHKKIKHLNLKKVTSTFVASPLKIKAISNQSPKKLNESVPKQKRIHWLAVISFVLAIFGLILLSIDISLIAIITAFISILVITFNTDQYEGSGLAVGAIFIALFAILVALIITGFTLLLITIFNS